MGIHTFGNAVNREQDIWRFTDPKTHRHKQNVILI